MVKKKGGTVSATRKYKFTSFRDKLDAIKIDPIRRTRKKITDHSEDQESYFITALQHHHELNLSVNFADFYDKVEPCSRSLPLLLHYKQDVAEALFEHVEKKDKHSIESLLDLLTQFARDLGPEFEQYFGRSLQVLRDIAMDTTLPQDDYGLVVEHAFTCMAYLFKYLSRLLVEDLRPTFNAVTPVMGKTKKQREFVSRFAAESLSFLLRKCTGESLDNMMDAILTDAVETESDAFFATLTTLISGAMVSSGENLHSKTNHILSALLRRAQSPRAADLAAGVVAALLHHSRADSANVVYETVYQYIDSEEVVKSVAVKMMYVLAGLRKGSRVTDWSSVYSHSLKVFTNEDPLALLELASTLVISAEFSASSRYHGQVLSQLDTLIDAPQFLTFCHLVLDQNKDAFVNFCMPTLKTFVSTQWQGNEYSLLLLLSAMYKKGLVTFGFVPGAMQLDHNSHFANATRDYICSTELDLLDVEVQIHVWYALELFRIAIKPDTQLLDHLPSILDKLMGAVKTPLVSALIGKILSLSANKSHKGLIEELMPELERLRESEPFVEGYLDMLTVLKDDISEAQLQAIALKLVPCLNAASPTLREVTLRILNRLYKLSGQKVPKLVEQCQTIENTPLDLANSRTMTMHIRNLGINFSTSGADVIVDEVVPRFMFGLLTKRFQPVWKATFDALEKCEQKAGGLIWQLSHNWLENRAVADQFAQIEAVPKEEYEPNTVLNCTNLNLQIKATNELADRYTHAENHVKLMIVESVETRSMPDFARQQALQVLIKLPRMAERHHKVLVPYLLHEEDEDDEENNDWSWKDRLAILELFALFVNPKSLTDTDRVYERYLYLLGNRAVQVQQVALKCVLTFKDPIVRKYGESLRNLLDETRFKDEINNLLNTTTEDEATLHEDDRHAVIPLVIRIIFGRSQIAKTGGGVKSGWRGAVVSSLKNVEPQFVRLFISLATGRLDSSGFLQFKSESTTQVNVDHPSLKESSMIRRELGFVTMLEKLVDILRQDVQPGVDLIMEALIFSMYHASITENREAETGIVTKSCKNIRSLGTKCLDLLFGLVSDVDWSPYFGVIFDNFISPKLQNFAGENMGQVSSLMNFFKTLSSTNQLASYFSWGDCAIPDALFSCLAHDSVKDSVVDLCMSTMLNVCELEDAKEIVQTSASLVLARLPVLFERDSAHDLLDKEAKVLLQLLDKAEVSIDSRKPLIRVSLSALEKPTNKIRVDVKVTIMQALSHLLVHEDTSSDEIEPIFTSLAVLFKQFPDRRARENLAKLYQAFGKKVDKFAVVGDLIVELNSYSRRRLQEVDYERRLEAFKQVTEVYWDKFSAVEWLPLLYNMLFFIKDKEEMALRTNAGFAIRRFIDCLSSKDSETSKPYVAKMDSVLVPAVRLGLRDANIMFRKEFIDILWYIVKDAKNVTEFDDMKCLLFDGDEEADFFYNITHIQQHRQQRAVKRLAQFGENLELRDTSIAHYLLPIIEHNVLDETGDAHNLSTETINAIGVLTRHLSWNQYRAITKRYVSYLANKPDSMKITIRLIDTVADSLLKEQEVRMETDQPYGVQLQAQLPKQDKLNSFITDDIVPTMQTALKTRREEQEDDLTVRIPLAIPIVKFLKKLPGDILETKLPGVLTKFCQILRAKSQPLRDMIRKSLGKIGRILGAEYLVFIIKEMRNALRRGTQLHVLGYSLHSLLTEMKDDVEHGDLDDASWLISEIIMEDTFGVTASEKEAEDFKSKMKEIKQHKSFDTGQILATNVSLEVFGNIIEPVKTVLLYEKLTLNIERKIEELLRRVALGLMFNQEATQQPVLKMCHELNEMTRNVEAKEKAKREKVHNESTQDRLKREQKEHFMVTLESRHWGEKDLVRVQNLYVIQKFIIEALRNILNKTTKLMTAENVAPFMPMLEQSLQSSYETVQIATLRLLSLIIKLPIPNMTEKLKSFGRQTVAIIKACSSTNSELCQAALRFMSVLVRLKTDFTMKDSAYAYLLERIKPDLEEPDRQGITFTFIKSVLTRKLVLPEVYDVMDTVAQAMVTNQDKSTRDTCRSAYFQFLTEYPQGTGRLNKQLQFLVGNLEYDAPDGRLSVMEMMHLLLTKIQNDQIQSVTTSFFVALVLVLVNDDVTKCREHAAMLIQELIGLVDGKPEQELVEDYCRTWVGNNDEALLLRGGLQVTGIYIKTVANPDAKLVKQARDKIEQILEASKSEAEESVTWDVVYFALQLWDKFVEQFHSEVFTKPYEPIWQLVESTLLYPHTWVRLSASRLLGKLFKHIDQAQKSGAKIEVDIEPLQSTAFKTVRQLGAASIDQELGIQIVKNLVFMTRQFEKNHVMFERKDKAEDEEDGDDEDEEKLTVTGWLIRKASSILRGEKRAKEMVVSKQSAVQYIASVIQLVSVERLQELGYDIILAFYTFSTSNEERDKDFKDLSTDALKMVQNKLGTTDYLQLYSQVRSTVHERRVERKKKRAVQAVAEPELHAKKKIKKNLAKREKRKHVKDENGYYHKK